MIKTGISDFVNFLAHPRVYPGVTHVLGVKKTWREFGNRLALIALVSPSHTTRIISDDPTPTRTHLPTKIKENFYYKYRA